MHAFASARKTTKHSGITRVQARDVKSCDTLSRHGQKHDTVADRTSFSFLRMRISFKRSGDMLSELKRIEEERLEKRKKIGQKVKWEILLRSLIYFKVCGR